MSGGPRPQRGWDSSAPRKSNETERPMRRPCALCLILCAIGTRRGVIPDIAGHAVGSVRRGRRRRAVLGCLGWSRIPILSPRTATRSSCQKPAGAWTCASSPIDLIYLCWSAWRSYTRQRRDRVSRAPSICRCREDGYREIAEFINRRIEYTRREVPAPGAEAKGQ